MGLFDKVKNKIQEKANEIHVCHHCGKEFSGLFSGIKASDGVYFCTDCFPAETKLMKQKGVCGDFSIYRLDSQGCEKYLAYREKERKRATAFSETGNWLGGNLLVDAEHRYFKLADFDEVFEIQQIKYLIVGGVYHDGKISALCSLSMGNPIYKTLPVEFVMKPTAFFKKNQYQEFYNYVHEFRESVCPHADLDLGKF